MQILIVEDDALIAEHLKEIIEEKDGFSVRLAYSAEEALVELNSEISCDLVLLDINMESSEAGIELAIILKNEFMIPFIFITAQSNDAIIRKAAVLEPLAYIVKPFMPITVTVSLELAKEKIKDSNLVFRDGYKEVVIPCESITHGQSNNNYVEIFGLRKKWVIRITMKELMELLPADRFIQIHRSYFINTNFLESASASQVVVRGISLPVSKAYELSVKEIFQ